jgi:short-subunit dehydrogenase
MSKRGLVAYSDALRLEHGDQIAVTTVFVGYIATAIHEASASQGMALEGAVPRERLEDAARTLAEASLGRAARDRATTRRGALSYALASRTPGRVMDLVVRARARQLAKRGHFDRSDLAREYVARLKAWRVPPRA